LYRVIFFFVHWTSVARLKPLASFFLLCGDVCQEWSVQCWLLHSWWLE